jgi:hypothetical protein
MAARHIPPALSAAEEQGVHQPHNRAAMAKQRRARNATRLTTGDKSPAPAERPLAAPAAAHARKLNKRVRFLQRVCARAPWLRRRRVLAAC